MFVVYSFIHGVVICIGVIEVYRYAVYYNKYLLCIYTNIHVRLAHYYFRLELDIIIFRNTLLYLYGSLRDSIMMT